MKITSDDIFKFIVDRQNDAKNKTVLSNDIVNAHGVTYIGLLFVTFGLLRIAEAMENAKENQPL